MERVDWSQVRHAYGLADNVPDLLLDLYDDDEAAREAAVDELWGSLCHQETVYSASAAAVSFLWSAARDAPLSEPQRYLVLGLIVYIGRGTDSCWERYASIDEVRACEQAVAAVAPEIVRWSVGRGPGERATSLQLLAYHAEALRSADVELDELASDGADARERAGIGLIAAIVAGRGVDAAALRATAAVDEDALDYLDDALADAPLEQQVRTIALELLNLRDWPAV